MYINFAPELFLEVTEMVRFKQSLDDQGFRKALLKDSVNFGLVKSLIDSGFNNGRVERDVDNALNQKTVKIGAIAGIDNEGRFITLPQTNNFPVPSDANWYWIRATHQYTTLESGKVTIDASGNMTGVGTEFKLALRSNQNFPSFIRFTNSVGNILEYEVADITDDSHAIVVHPAITAGGQASFAPESNLTYETIGTFTEGFAVPEIDKRPFRYDLCQITLQLETVNNTKPSYVAGQEFYLARVKVSNGNLVIQDKRTDFWETKGSNKVIEIERGPNPLIGVEAVRWQNIYNTGDRNIVDIAWGMRSDNWSIDSSQNIVTFQSATGGSFKTVNDFTDGDLNGGRLYTSNGKYSKITNSIKQGGAINLYLDTLDVDNFSLDGGATFTGDLLLATPDADAIEIRFIPETVLNAAGIVDPTLQIYNIDENDKFEFNINTPIAKCLPTVYNDLTCKYIALYRYKSFKEFTQWRPINSGSYFTERSFFENGLLKPSTERIVYPYLGNLLSAFLQLEISPNSWKRFKETVYKGDIIGVNTISTFVAGQVVELKVGVDKRYQHIVGNVALTDDIYISLSRLKAIEGNEFRIHFECSSLNMGTKKFIICDDYASGTLSILKQFSMADAYQMMNMDGGCVIDCVYDNTGKWIMYQNYDLGQPFSVHMFTGELETSFDVLTGLGKTKGWFGHALMDGRNGTTDCEDRFMLATTDPLKYKIIDGVDNVILDIQNLPPHDHDVHGNIANRNTSGGGFPVLQVYTNGPAGGADKAPTSKTGGNLDGTTKPFTIKPKHYALAYVQKLF